MFGPFAPNFIAISPAAMSMIIIGIMNAETRRGSAACDRMLSTSVSTPPIPEPKATPTRGASSGVIWSLASPSACVATATANCTNRSARRISLRSMYSRGSKSPTSPAIVVSSPVGSNRVICPIPLLPARRPSQLFSTDEPRGVIMPMPVMTTRRRSPLRMLMSLDFGAS